MRIRTVENMPPIKATSVLYAASTRDLATEDWNLPKGFCRRNKGLISYFGTIFAINFNFNLLWATHKGILKLLNVLKHVQIIQKLSYIEKYLWNLLARIYLGARRLPESATSLTSRAPAMQWVGLRYLSHWCRHSSFHNLLLTAQILFFSPYMPHMFLTVFKRLI